MISMIDIGDFKLNLEIFVLILTTIGASIKGLMVLYRYMKVHYDNLMKVHAQINTIFKELTPNGGGSLKDNVNQLTIELKKNTDMTEVIYHSQHWLLDNRDEPIFESQSDGKCTWVNKPYMNLLRRDMSYFINHGWKSAIHDDDRERVVENWNSAVRDGRLFEDTYRMVDSTGKSIKVECTATKMAKGGYIGNIKVL